MSMRYKYLLLLTVSAIAFCCKKEKQVSDPGVPPPPPAPPVVFVKNIEIANLPSPYYHFEYNASGKVTVATFSSGLRLYDVFYNADRISEIKNNTMVNKDRLQYSYSNDGKVILINYVDEGGVLFKRAHFTYDGAKLTNIEWERKEAAGFIAERELELVYQADGNVSEITDRRFPVAGQTAAIHVTRFEQYDNRINADGFTLIHEMNDHLLLLPGVQLQKNNPGKLIRSGDGLNYGINYTYTYNTGNLPLTKSGEVTITNGPNAGQKFQSNTVISYY